VARGDARALSCWEARYGALWHMATSKPSRAERWDWSHRARGSTIALSRQEVGLVPWYTW
jgi:hypothetical protein